MVMNRRGITAMFDALMFIVLIGVAANIVAATSIHADDAPGVQDPSDVLDAMFSARLDPQDLGIDAVEMRTSATLLAYVSLLSDDGCFMQYAGSILNGAYPWDGAYRFEISWSGGTERIGSESDRPWMTAERTYPTGYGEDLVVKLTLYR